MMISSAGKERSASSIATFGSESPTSPRAFSPASRIAISDSSIRWRASSIASSTSEAQCAAREPASAGVRTRISAFRPRQRLLISSSRARPVTVSLATASSR